MADVSDRRLQFSDKPPQFSLGKSARAFGPIGPALVEHGALAEEHDPQDLALTCDVGDERMQNSRTSQLIFGVPEVLSYISSFMTLSPGDLVLTGTPDGVGPMQIGDEIEVDIDGIGSLLATVEAEGAIGRP